ncbi:peptidylprolyl isomerase [Clostridium omnivorum]|uniref:Peptidylprolyl isomerase n=1 Tax=Clostridium omnivorum TaxID=1604902 RepID=A0ABQ5N5Z6_9CLOT|nr:peptidylprolyl isomerase [Clostridium sp. E14]GLC30653.1 peptidylprolyl isomerase [Clostridium sp. E14]
MENNILAVVNGKEILEKDLELAITRLPKDRQSFFNTPQGKKQLLNQIISFELFYNYGKDNGIENDENYKAQLEIAKNDLITQFAINSVLKDVNVTDEEVEKYYEANKSYFMSEEEVMASHILVATLEEAQEVAKNIKEGMEFEEAAKEFSSCPSSAQGGNLGKFGRGRMVPEFEEAAFILKVGEISEPVKTQFGYHIIKVLEKFDAELRPFAEVAGLIRNEILQERQNFKYMQFVEDLKQTYNVEIK